MNGNYLVCAYQNEIYTSETHQSGSISVTQYFGGAPFFASEVISCQNGQCGTFTSTAPFSPPPCVGQNGQSCGIGTGIGTVTSFNGFQAGLFANTACSIFGELNIIFGIFALILILVGAALYAGASLLPAQQRGVAQAYAFGFVLVAIIAAIIAAVSIYALSVAGNTTVGSVLSLCEG